MRDVDLLRYLPALLTDDIRQSRLNIKHIKISL